MNVLYVVLLGAAFTSIELMIGGTRLLFSLPAYGLLALAAILSVFDIRRPKPSPGGLCLGASALFFGYILARTLTSPVAYIAWDDEFMVIGCLMIYLLTACYYTDPRRRLWLLGVLLALVVVNLVVGARQFAGGDGFMLFWFVRSKQYLGRASGLFICPDHLAGYLEMVGCLSLSITLWSRVRGWVRILIGYGALMCLGGLLITGSRGGFLSIGAGLGTLTLLSLWRVRVNAPKQFARAVLVVVAIAGIGALGIGALLTRSDLIASRFHTLLDYAHDDRPQLWAAALPQFELSPALGTGAATYLYYGRMFRSPHIQNDPIRPHSDYLELLAEYGLVGVAGLALFLWAHLRRGWLAYRHLSLRGDALGGQSVGSNVAAWNIGALSAVACLLTHSTVDFNLHIPANALLMAFVFGVLANPGRNLDPDGGGQVARLRRVDFLPRLALPALGVWMAVAGLPKLPGEFYCEKARVALRDGHNVAVLGLAGHGLEHESRNPSLYYYLGQARQNLAGNGPDTPIARSFRQAAAEAYRAGLKLAPMDIFLLVHQGEMLTRLGDFSGAADVFQQVERCDPNSGYADTYYGFYLQSRGMLPEAEEAYRQASMLYPNSSASRNLEEVERARAASEKAE